MFTYTSPFFAPLALFVAIQLQALDKPWNPFDTSKLEMILCTSKCIENYEPAIDRILCHYFIPLDTETYRDALEQLKETLRSTLKTKQASTQTMHRSVSAYRFFYEPYVNISDKRFYKRNLLKLTAINEMSPEVFIKDLKILPFEDAYDDLFNKPLTVTWEPCNPDENDLVSVILFGKKSSKN